MKKVVVITGATAGLGLSLAAKFLQSGDQVFGISRTKKHWTSARKRLGRTKQLELFQLDVTSESDVAKFFDKLRKRTKRVDVVINNAGYVDVLTPVDRLTLAEFQSNIDHNLISTFLMCKYAIPVFRKQGGGLLVNISSMAGKRAVPKLAAYSAAKFGVVALTQAIAKENEGARWKCFAVCPGGINTQMRAKIFGRADSERQQSADFVANVIVQAVNSQIQVESGGDIVIRHGKITAVNPLPEA
jgi:NAD(P)-dependent dehydrogenase (short-subunit alcohol dehydrogenase family)